MKYLLLMIFIALLPLSSCYSGVHLSVNKKLPERRPNDLVIHYNNNGGMVMLNENMFISEDSCTFSYNYGGSTGIAKFSMTGKELDDLYNIFKDNSFEDIESDTIKVYDRGGVSISLSWDSEKIYVSNAGMHFVKEKWQKEWENIVNPLVTIIELQRTLN